MAVKLFKLKELNPVSFKGFNPTKKEDGPNYLVPSGAVFPGGLREDRFKSIKENNLEKKLLKADILFNTGGVGTLGRTGYFSRTDGTYIPDSFVFVLRFDNSSILSKYVFHWLQSPKIKEQIIQKTSGTTGITSIKPADILSLEIPVPVDKSGKPDAAVQLHIVSTLDSIEKTKKQREESNQKTAELIPALFRKMFGDLNSNPLGWHKKDFSQCVTIGTRLVNPTKDEYSSLTQIGPENIVGGTGELINLRSAQDKRIQSNNFTFSDKHVLYSKIRPYLNKVAYPQFSGICSADVYPLLPDEALIDPFFLQSVLRSKEFLDYSSGVSERLRMPKLNKAQLGSYQIIVPPIKIQREFAQKVASIIELQKEQKESKGMIDNLFSSVLSQLDHKN